MSTIIGKRVYDALNKQINDEMITAYFFLAASGILKDMGLSGCSRWAASLAKETMDDSLEIFQYLMIRKTKVRLLQIPAPKQDWRAPLHIFEEASRRAQTSTGSLYTIYEYSVAEKDHASSIMLMPMIERKIKVETEITNLLEKLRRMQTTEMGVFTFDAELNDSMNKKEK